MNKHTLASHYIAGWLMGRYTNDNERRQNQEKINTFIRHMVAIGYSINDATSIIVAKLK